MQVNTNVQALVAANAINLATQQAARASERIGSSLRINSAADDPGSMIMINSIKSKIASWSKANDNITSANGMLQTMSSTLTSVSDLLSKMRALAVSSVNAQTATQVINQTTFAAYRTQMDNLSTLAKWNGISLLNNSGGTVSIQAGVDAGNTITVNLYNTASSNLGDAGSKVSTLDLSVSADTAITQIDKAITTISGYQTAVGASLNIMASQSSYNTGISTANNSTYAALTNADIAAETANLAAAQIRQSSASAMLAQSTQMNKDLVKTLLQQFIN
jgi:flagellin